MQVTSWKLQIGVVKLFSPSFITNRSGQVHLEKQSSPTVATRASYKLPQLISMWDWAFWNIITEWLSPRSGCQLFWIIWRRWSRTYQRPTLPIPMVTKTESYFTVKGNDPRWGKCCIQTMLTRKRPKCQEQLELLRQSHYRSLPP